MSQPERPTTNLPHDISRAEMQTTPAPINDSEAGSDTFHAAGEIVRRTLAGYDQRQRHFGLVAERLKIFSEWLAIPIRLPRDNWFAAWRQIADGTASDDLDTVVNGIEAATKAFAALNVVVTQWFLRAREWQSRARPIYSGFTGLIGFETLESFDEWDSEERTCLPALLADKQEFLDWALTIEQLRSLRSIHPQISGLSCSLYDVPTHCLDLLALIMAGATTGQVRTFFMATRGPKWLAGLAGVMAVLVGPLLPRDVFRITDLPANDFERRNAWYLTNLTVHAFGHFSQCTQFAEQHFPLQPSAPMELPEWQEVGSDCPGDREAEMSQPTRPPQDRDLSADPPAWDAKTRTLTVRGKSKTARSNGTRIVQILDAFERAGWPFVSVTMVDGAAPGDRAKCICRFLESLPIDILPDGTGNGMTWAWKSGG